MSMSHAERVASLRDRIDEALVSLVAEREPRVLYESVAHVLQAGGKRVRPIVLLLVADASGSSVDRAFPAALAVEVFHNFTLVHDDLMDESDERRGRPTIHAKWDSGRAILAGDLMMGLSYDLLGRVDGCTLEALYDVYHPMVEKLCAGQALDEAFEHEELVSVEAYLDMIDRKTGALLSAAFELGGVIGGVSESDQRRLRRAGELVGRAFQIQDDLLDLTADDDDWGRAVGGDLVAGKKTFVTLCALERAEGEDYEWFARLVHDGGIPRNDVPEARARMDALGVFDDARKRVVSYTKQAYEQLENLPMSDSLTTLQWFLDRLQARTY